MALPVSYFLQYVYSMSSSAVLTGADLTFSSVNDDVSSQHVKLTAAANHLTLAGANSNTGVRLSNLAAPQSDTDAARKLDIDTAIQGLTVKDSVRAASTVNVSIDADDNSVTITTMDGVTLTHGDRLLLKDQTTASENGIYTYSAITGEDSTTISLARSADFDSGAEVLGAFVFVEEGTVNGDQGYVHNTNVGGGITVGTTPLGFTQFSGAGQITAGDGLSKSGNTISLASTHPNALQITNTTNSTSTTTGALIVTGGVGIGDNMYAGGNVEIEGDQHLQSDSAVLYFGADDDVSLTHIADTGLRLNSGSRLEFKTANAYIDTEDSDQLRLYDSTAVFISAGDTNEAVEVAESETTFYGTLVVTGSSITTTGGSISFDDENLSTSGTLGCGQLTAASGSSIGNLTLSDGSITSSGSSISFDNENLSTSGTLGCGQLTAASGSSIGNLTLSDGSITSSGSSISFDDENLSTTGSFTAGSVTATTVTSTSDARLKSNVNDIAEAVAKVQQLRGVDFTWKDSGKADAGVIAQEVEEVAPHWVVENAEGIKSVDYGKLSALLIQAVKEQQATIDKQSSDISELKAAVAALQAERA